MGFMLLPKEQLICSYPCKHRRNLSGIMHITNIRVCWVPDEDVADKINEVDIPMSEINVHKEVEYVIQVNQMLLLYQIWDISHT